VDAYKEDDDDGPQAALFLFSVACAGKQVWVGQAMTAT
jgi:hypothetical protein